MATQTRQRMVEAAAGLLQSGGLAAASFTDVVSRSGAARGAIYHHFPGGKAELAREAVAWTGRRIREEFASIDAEAPEAVVAEFLTMVRPVVKRAAAGVSCAVAVVTVESAQFDPDLTEAVDVALRSWVGELERRLLQAGATASQAHIAAMLLITFLEGTQVLCRAAGSITPFDEAAVGLTVAARALLGLRAT